MEQSVKKVHKKWLVENLNPKSSRQIKTFIRSVPRVSSSFVQPNLDLVILFYAFATCGGVALTIF